MQKLGDQLELLFSITPSKYIPTFTLLVIAFSSCILNVIVICHAGQCHTGDSIFLSALVQPTSCYVSQFLIACLLVVCLNESQRVSVTQSLTAVQVCNIISRKVYSSVLVKTQFIVRGGLRYPIASRSIL